MRAPIMVLSIISAVILVVFGGFLNAVSGFGIDILLPYNAPVRVVATFSGDAPGIALALAALGFALYDAARRGGVGWFIGLLAWPVVPLVAASLMFAGVLAYATFWFLPLAFIPLAPLLYALAGPTEATVPTHGQAVAVPRSRVRALVGVFAVVAVAAVVFVGVIALFSSSGSGANRVTGSPPLQVSQTSFTADCANGVYPPVTVANTGAQAQQWRAVSQDANVVANPSSGTLAPGASVSVTFSGTTTAPSVIVQFVTGAQTNGVAKVGCQASASK